MNALESMNAISHRERSSVYGPVESSGTNSRGKYPGLTPSKEPQEIIPCRCIHIRPRDLDRSTLHQVCS